MAYENKDIYRRLIFKDWFIFILIQLFYNYKWFQSRIYNINAYRSLLLLLCLPSSLFSPLNHHFYSFLIYSFIVNTGD